MEEDHLADVVAVDFDRLVRLEVEVDFTTEGNQ